ncbi:MULTISPECIES: helix-turn-helix domain-containing protein [Oceanobacillus]|uniref:HTH cro/C1-type domain-containing protein n=1 Tax=Oceanobacillus kimchii TaxID=746691 RepID=A0ABQ5TPN8_9BACI|nr:helix-turn-helix transcriptional regulator [Oceanobacillus kimchii]GLO68371.1 hypothetical protein MACH08_41550 [Oceanobacillus kimchii]
MISIQKALQIRITELCKQRSISILKLAELSKVNQSTINEFMQGRTKYPSVNTIKKISDGFEMSLSEFFNDDVFNKVVTEENKKQ